MLNCVCALFFQGFKLLDEEHLPDPSDVGVLALDLLDGGKLEVRMRMAG